MKQMTPELDKALRDWSLSYELPSNDMHCAQTRLGLASAYAAAPKADSRLAELNAEVAEAVASAESINDGCRWSNMGLRDAARHRREYLASLRPKFMTHIWDGLEGSWVAGVRNRGDGGGERVVDDRHPFAVFHGPNAEREARALAGRWNQEAP